MMSLSGIEEKIVNTINYIRNEKRKRPCTREIYNAIKNNSEELETFDISVFNEALIKLQAENIIYDGGKDGKESFFINEVTPRIYSETSNFGNDSNINKFINEKFYETLINRIKLEVKHEINSVLNTNHINSESIGLHNVIGVTMMT